MCTGGSAGRVAQELGRWEDRIRGEITVVNSDGCSSGREAMRGVTESSFLGWKVVDGDMGIGGGGRGGGRDDREVRG